MSITITVRAIPEVARSSWETVNEHLLFKHGDWDLLRRSLVETVCSARANELGGVSAVEQLLLQAFYESRPVYVDIREALALVRQELIHWPEETIALAERLVDGGQADVVRSEAFRLAARSR
jgi:hypothetical protein